MKLSKLKIGDVVVADASFSCLKPGEHVVDVRHEKPDMLFVACAGGDGDGTERHYLDGQLGEDGHLIGFSKPEKHKVKLNVTKTDLVFLKDVMALIKDDEDANGALAHKWHEVFLSLKHQIEEDGA